MPPQLAAGMRYLFIHQNAPGQYLHVLRRLAANPANDVVMIGLHESVEIPGVRRIAYSFDPRGVSAVPPSWPRIPCRAGPMPRRSPRSAAQLPDPGLRAGRRHRPCRLGRAPQHPGCLAGGAGHWLLRILLPDRRRRCRLRPGIPDAGGAEPRVRAKNAVNLLTLQQTTLGQTPTRWQRSTYPDWARRRVPPGCLRGWISRAARRILKPPRRRCRSASSRDSARRAAADLCRAQSGALSGLRHHAGAAHNCCRRGPICM